MRKVFGVARTAGLVVAVLSLLATSCAGIDAPTVASPSVNTSATGRTPSTLKIPTRTTITDTTSTTGPAASTAASTTTQTTETTTTTTATPTTEYSEIRWGDEGDHVLAVQEQLSALGYWLGTPDGIFGDATFHAVVAFQKVAGLEPDATITQDMKDGLLDAVIPQPRSSTDRAIEIDLTRQIVLVVSDGVVDFVFDTSTGAQPGTTPTGEWIVEREIDGLRESALGLLYRPKYFYRGVAIHGYTNVPPYPASHGCVRLTYGAMDVIWAEHLAPIGTPVIVY